MLINEYLEFIKISGSLHHKTIAYQQICALNLLAC